MVLGRHAVACNGFYGCMKRGECNLGFVSSQHQPAKSCARTLADNNCLAASLSTLIYRLISSSAAWQGGEQMGCWGWALQLPACAWPQHLHSPHLHRPGQGSTAHVDHICHKLSDSSTQYDMAHDLAAEAPAQCSNCFCRAHRSILFEEQCCLSCSLALQQ
jgi:hypothetical protein